MVNSKIVKCLVLALLFGAVATPGWAQLYHQLGFSVNTGYASMVSSAADVRPGKGFNIAAGFDYELQYGHLLFDTGLGLQWNSAWVRVDSSSVLLPNTLLDSQQGEYRMFIATDHRTDASRVGQLQIPMLVGGIYGNFYFLGGFKLQVPLFGVTRIRANVTTQGYYSKYLQPVQNQDKHGFRTDEVNIRSAQLKTTPVDLLASMEVGYNFSLRDEQMRAGVKSVRETRIRIAAYADYGLISQRGTYYDAPYVLTDAKGLEHTIGAEQIMPREMVNRYDIDRFTATHILNTEKTLNTYLANFSVGMKFTVLFGAHQKFLCLTCESAVERGINNPDSGFRQSNNRKTEGAVITPLHHNDNGTRIK